MVGERRGEGDGEWARLRNVRPFELLFVYWDVELND